MNPGNFFAELKRRNVYKVAVAYAIIAWLLIQAASILFPTFEAPAWAMRIFVTAVALGFPIALILAWALELTPEGIKLTESGNGDLAKPTRSKVWIYIAAIGGVLSVGLFSLGRYTAVRTSSPGSVQSADPSLPAKSIAVLPFENLSEEKANAYFASGIQDEIMTRLAKIADLKVISRTSTQQYKSSPENLREIAKQLGVAHVVEGSVQKSGDAVRVNVRLIKATNDSQLWADTFDRKLIDIFSVESDVAKAVADQLRARLTGREEQVIAAKPTDNPAAYDAYLRGLAYNSKTQTTPANSLGAQKYLREAVRLDPKFALAWALLSIVDAGGYIAQNLQPTLDLREEA